MGADIVRGKVLGEMGKIMGWVVTAFVFAFGTLARAEEDIVVVWPDLGVSSLPQGSQQNVKFTKGGRRPERRQPRSR